MKLKCSECYSVFLDEEIEDFVDKDTCPVCMETDCLILQIELDRKSLLIEAQELQADFEDFSNEQLIFHRDIMTERVNKILRLLHETNEDNI